MSVRMENIKWTGICIDRARLSPGQSNMDRQEEKDRRRKRIEGKRLVGGGGSWTQDKRGRVRIDLYDPEEDMNGFYSLGRFSISDWEKEVELAEAKESQIVVKAR